MDQNYYLENVSQSETNFAGPKSQSFNNNNNNNNNVN